MWIAVWLVALYRRKHAILSLLSTYPRFFCLKTQIGMFLIANCQNWRYLWYMLQHGRTFELFSIDENSNGDQYIPYFYNGKIDEDSNEYAEMK